MTRVLIGGVGYRWTGDASFGLAVTEALARERWPDGIEVADLDYGALYVALDFADHRPPLDRVVLVAGTLRKDGREPGTLRCIRWRTAHESDEEVQARVREAGAGVVDLDHLLVIGERLGALPAEVFCVELEVADLTTGERLSDTASPRVAEACAMVRALAVAPAAEHDGVTLTW